MKFLIHRLFTVLFAFSLVEIAAAADSADSLIDKGKVFEKKFKADEALPLYLAAEKLEPKNPDLLVRIARWQRGIARHNGRQSSNRRRDIGPGHHPCGEVLAPRILRTIRDGALRVYCRWRDARHAHGIAGAGMDGGIIRIVTVQVVKT